MSGRSDNLAPVTPKLPIILLVEDDENDALLARRALARISVPHQIVHVDDGEEALKYLSGAAPYEDRAKYPLPSLLLLDLKMPRVTGLEVLHWLQAHPELKEIPVVVLTGSIHERDRVDANKLGAVGYEIKPVDFTALIKIVEEVSGRWLPQPPPSQPL